MKNTDYPHVRHLIDRDWIAGAADGDRAVFNPANGLEIGHIPQVTAADLDRAVRSADAAFPLWEGRSPTDRGAILRRFADLLRLNDARIARWITLDEGKPLAEALAEVRSSADHVDWHAEEGRRSYGRIVMGPLCHAGRVAAMETPVADARDNGAAVLTGGRGIGNSGSFYAPTLVDTPDDSIALMREEPFGPVAIVSPFREIEDGLARANGLPFGGVRDSGYGSEGGTETFDGYLCTKFISRNAAPAR